MVRLRHIVAIGSLVVALGINAMAWAAQARAQTQNRAGLIVQLADGSVVTRCVSFNEESLSGYELLRRANLPLVVEVTGMGPAVCKIGDTGCNYPQQSCFCQCNTLDASCTYWTYAQLNEGTWRPSPLGAAGSIVRNGNVDGWRWGKGNGDAGEYPPAISFDEICGAPAQAVSQPTAQQVTALPATATAAPTDMPLITPVETATLVPTAMPSATSAPAATATLAASATTAATQPAPTATSMPLPTFSPTATPPSGSPSTDNNALSLLGFGAIAAVLVLGFAIVRRRGGT